MITREYDAMAQRVITQLVSDLSGQELADGEGRSIDFAYDGKSYRIDLTQKEADAFDKAVQKYVDSATRVSVGSGRRSSSAGPRRTGEDAGAIREWAQKNGFTVSERGRISSEVRDAYAAAH